MRRALGLLILVAVTGAGWRIFPHKRKRPPLPPTMPAVVWPTWREDLDCLEARLGFGARAAWTTGRAWASIRNPQWMR